MTKNEKLPVKKYDFFAYEIYQKVKFCAQVKNTQF